MRAEDGANGAPLPSVDQDVLEVLRGMQADGEPDLLVELVEIFTEDASAGLVALREALDQGDAEGLEQRAHALKGGAGNLGVSRRAQIAARLETLGRSGDLEGAGDLLEDLQSEFEKARAELSASVLRS